MSTEQVYQLVEFSDLARWVLVALFFSAIGGLHFWLRNISSLPEARQFRMSPVSWSKTEVSEGTLLCIRDHFARAIEECKRDDLDSVMKELDKAYKLLPIPTQLILVSGPGLFAREAVANLLRHLRYIRKKMADGEKRRALILKLLQERSLQVLERALALRALSEPKTSSRSS